jgi:hypothetical protein
MTESAILPKRTAKRKSTLSATSRGRRSEGTEDQSREVAPQPALDRTRRTSTPTGEVQISIDVELAKKVEFVAASDVRMKLFDQFVSALEESPLDSDRVEIRRRISERFSQVSADADSHDAKVADRSSSEVSEVDAELLARSREYKAKLLRSAEFKSVAQAGKILGVSEELLRRRIRQKTQFALTNGERGAYRIPVWTLDKSLGPRVMRRLLACAQSAGMDSWALELFMKCPNAELAGFCPLDVLTLRPNKRDLAEMNAEGLVENLSVTPRIAVLELVCAAVVREMELFL